MVPAVRREGGGSGRFCGGLRCGRGIIANLRRTEYIVSMRHATDEVVVRQQAFFKITHTMLLRPVCWASP